MPNDCSVHPHMLAWWSVDGGRCALRIERALKHECTAARAAWTVCLNPSARPDHTKCQAAPPHCVLPCSAGPVQCVSSAELGWHNSSGGHSQVPRHRKAETRAALFDSGV